MNYLNGEKVNINDYVSFYGTYGTIIADYDSKKYLNDDVRQKWNSLEDKGGIIIEFDNGQFLHLDRLIPFQPLNDETPVPFDELELVLIRKQK